MSSSEIGLFDTIDSCPCTDKDCAGADWQHRSGIEWMADQVLGLFASRQYQVFHATAPLIPDDLRLRLANSSSERAFVEQTVRMGQAPVVERSPAKSYPWWVTALRVVAFITVVLPLVSILIKLSRHSLHSRARVIPMQLRNFRDRGSPSEQIAAWATQVSYSVEPSQDTEAPAPMGLTRRSSSRGPLVPSSPILFSGAPRFSNGCSSPLTK